MSRATAAALLLTATFSLLLAQRDTVWVRRLSGTGNSDDQVRLLAPDQAGNIYAVILNKPGDATDVVITAKYSPDGQLLWTRRFEADSSLIPRDIAFDREGNVFITGTWTGHGSYWPDIVTLKYSAAGESCWVRYFDADEDLDEAAAVLTDTLGNVYVAGTSWREETFEDFALLKYAGTGELLWSRFRDWDETEDFAFDAVIDPAGYIYEVGMTDTEDTTACDFFVLKYSLAGDLLWSRIYPATGPNDDAAFAAALDPQGNLVVAGQTTKHYDRDSAGILTVKVSAAGETLWSRVLLGRRRENGAVAVGTDAQANVVVAGNMEYAYQVVKYSSDGTELWRQRYQGPEDNDSLTAMEVTPAGDVYVTGWSEADRLYGDLDMATIKYSPAGESVWVRRWTTPDSVEASGLALTLAGTGICAGGWCEHKDRCLNGTLVRYDEHGNEQWVRQYSSPGPSGDEGKDIAFDADGNVVVVGYLDNTLSSHDLVVAKYSPAGDLLWKQTYGHTPYGDEEALAVQTDNWQNVYVTGYSGGDGTGQDYVTLKYDSEGNLVWVNRYDGPASGDDVPVGLAVDRSGNAVVTGQSLGLGTGLDYATVKYTPGGRELWVRRHNGSADSADYAGGVAVDSTGAAYVTGMTHESDGRYPATTVKYDLLGNVLWERQYEDPDTLWDTFWPKCVVLGPDGSVYIGGTGTYKFLAARITPDGETLWVREMPIEPTWNYVARSGTVDQQGRFCICGEVSNDYLAIGFSPTGEMMWCRRYNWADDWAGDVAVGADGVLFVTGRGNYHAVTIGYDSSGTEVWIDSLRGSILYSSGAAVAAGHGGRIAVAGGGCWPPYSEGDLLAVVYAPQIGLAESSRLPLVQGGRILSVQPNPFTGLARFRAVIPVAGRVVLEIFDRTGRLVRTMEKGTGLGTGVAEFSWNGADLSGHPVPNGVYFARVAWEPEMSGPSRPIRSDRIKLVRLK